MDEETLLSVDGIYRWDGPKAKATLAGTKLGRLILTNRRLIFLSSGGNDVLKRAVVAASRGQVAAERRAGRTDGLDAAAMDNAGSLNIPLGELEHYEFVKKMFKGYLSIRIKTRAGQEASFAFMNQMTLPHGRAWVELIDRSLQTHRAS